MNQEEYIAIKKEQKEEIKSSKKTYKDCKKESKLKIKNAKKEYTILKKENKSNKKEKELTPKQIKKRKKKLANIKRNQPPHLKVLEEIGNSVTHGLGALFAIVGFIMMLFKSSTFPEFLAAIIYCSSLFIMFAMSSLYHAFKYGSTVKRIFRRFDYSSIYLLIGGTFAPILLVFLGNALGNIVFVVQWVCIITGISLLGVFGPGRLKWLHFPLYFVLGWLGGVCVIPTMLRENMTFFYWILAGGIVYTLGMIPFCLKGKVAHFIWHIVVMIAAVLHFLGIYFCLY